jgi:hypothetical protein
MSGAAGVAAVQADPSDGAPAALYLPPSTSNALVISEDSQLAVASGGAAVVLNASRLAGARAAACVDASAGPSRATGPAVGDAGGEPHGPERATALCWHLRMRELADGCGGGGGGGDGTAVAGADDAASSMRASAPPVRGLAWSPAGAASAGGCLLALLAGGDQVR